MLPLLHGGAELPRRHLLLGPCQAPKLTGLSVSELSYLPGYLVSARVWALVSARIWALPCSVEDATASPSPKFAVRSRGGISHGPGLPPCGPAVIVAA